MFFPCSSAKSTVIRVPLLGAASTTITPSDNPLTILFLAGKLLGNGFSPTGYSEIISPLFKISLYIFI